MILSPILFLNFQTVQNIMIGSRRQQRISRLLQESLSRLLIQEIQSLSSSVLTVTRVEITANLKSAHVYLSLYGPPDDTEKILAHVEHRKGFLRKSIASLVKLKYNPMLIFSLDPIPNYEEKIDQLIKQTKKNDG
ncbi:MAG: 30S ribosome-binding factor RbfA [Candidatus Aminicenantales bacterium]